MANWKQTLNIKKVLKLGSDIEDDDALPDNIRAAMSLEIGLVQKNLRDDYYEDLVEELAEIQSVFDFNEWLENFYDWADRNLIWCGAL